MSGAMSRRDATRLKEGCSRNEERAASMALPLFVSSSRPSRDPSSRADGRAPDARHDL